MKKPNRDECVAMAQQCLSASLRKTERLVTRHYDTWLEPAGVTAVQLPMLAIIASQDEPSLRALAEQLGLDRSTLSRNLNYLRQRGWVKLGPSSGPKPGLISLTAEGGAALSRAHKLWQKAHRQLQLMLSEQTLTESLALLRRVRKKTRSPRDSAPAPSPRTDSRPRARAATAPNPRR